MQRMLASSGEAITQDETWLLQRLISTTDNPFCSPSNYRTAVNASSASFPNLNDDLFTFACDILFRGGGGRRAVVEKTPRNYFYVEYFRRHNVKSVGVVRRPSDILNSFFRTLLAGSFRGLVDYMPDINIGAHVMSDAKRGKGVFIIKYEELDDENEIVRLCKYADLTINVRKLPLLVGKIGDKNKALELTIKKNQNLTGIDTLVKKLVVKYWIKKYFSDYCVAFDYPIWSELERVESFSTTSLHIVKNTRDVFWLNVYFLQKLLFKLYRSSRRTTNLSKNSPCS